MAENKLPRGVVRDGKVHVEGEKGPYVQGMIRHLNVEVSDLTYHRGYSFLEGKSQMNARMRGTAVIGNGDKIAVGGSKVRDREMKFDLRPVAAGSEHEWRCHIGYLPHDWEISRPSEDVYFYLEVYLPPEAFADIEGAYVAGRVGVLSVRIDTTLWVREYDWHTPPSGDVTWFLVPSEKPSDMPRAERGTVEDFTWTELPPSTTRPAPVPNEGQPAYKAGARFADEVIRTAQVDAEAAPKKRSWGLVAAWTIFILFCAGYALVKTTS